MAKIVSFAKDSAVYGGSTILVRMMSWLMNMLFTRALLPSEYGLMTNLYAYIAVLSVVLTFGMETGLFRFLNHGGKYDSSTVYSTALAIVGLLTAVIVAVFLFFLDALRPVMFAADVPGNCIRMAIIILGIDAFSAVPFALIRSKKRALRFATLKILNVSVYAVSCIFLLVICPCIDSCWPGSISWFWDSQSGLTYVFVSNLAGTIVQTVGLLPELRVRFRFDGILAGKMVSYCFPLVITGLAGISSQAVDKLIFPAVYPDGGWEGELGLYSGCIKIALVMMIFTQAFRYAYEPFVFEESRGRDPGKSYARVMKYFIIAGWFIFLFVTLYIDIFKHFAGDRYWSALGAVAPVMVGELLFGVYFNLSVWYKLSDRTWWGTVFSVIGFAVTVTLNVIYIPEFGYMACAYASLLSNLVVMMLSYFIGRRHYRIGYDLVSAGIYTVMALLFYGLWLMIPAGEVFVRLSVGTLILAVYVFVVLRRDIPAVAIIRNYLHRKNIK
ncbi:MAG: lipopolysaccharide biosynthesis protein [Dysgonamonadaceae bacterium]|nr:lipopolysaccharide biosynthesis protein [Dysgonamonadaceae bacterium]